MADFPWVTVAKSLFGEREVSGSIDNPKIVELFNIVGHVEVKDDETAWCAAFVGSCLELSGYKSTRSLQARSYLKLGQRLDQPKKGCVAVLWRGTRNGWQGHVGFFDSMDENYVYLLGGNQSNSIRVAGYPLRQVLGYILPTEAGPVARSKLIKNIEQIRAGLPVEELADAGAGGEDPPGNGGIADLGEDGDAPSGYMGALEDLLADWRGLLGDEDVNDDPVPAEELVEPIMAKGSSGKQVEDLQLKLREKGFALGKIDSDFGAMTEAAVFEFQRANNLPGTGMVDRKTMEALFGGKGPELGADRRMADASELLDRGSDIIGNARQGQLGAVITAALAAFGVTDTLGLTKFLTATTSNTAATTTTTGTAPAEIPLPADMLSTIAGTGGGLWLALGVAGIFAWRKFGNAARERLEDHRSGINRRI